jgi:hypothetical protein
VKFKGVKMEYEVGVFILEDEVVFGFAGLNTGNKSKLIGFFFYTWCLGVEVTGE